MAIEATERATKQQPVHPDVKAPTSSENKPTWWSLGFFSAPFTRGENARSAYEPNQTASDDPEDTRWLNDSPLANKLRDVAAIVAARFKK